MGEGCDFLSGDSTDCFRFKNIDLIFVLFTVTVACLSLVGYALSTDYFLFLILTCAENLGTASFFFKTAGSSTYFFTTVKGFTEIILFARLGLILLGDLIGELLSFCVVDCVLDESANTGSHFDL